MSRESLHPVLILKNCQPLEEEGLGSFSKAPNKATMHLHFYGLCFSKTRSKWPVALTLKSPRWCISRDRFGSIKRWKLADEGTYWGAQGEQRNGLLLPPPRRSWLTLDLNMPESSISYKELGGRTQSINSVLAYGSATCLFFSTSSSSMRNPWPPVLSALGTQTNHGFPLIDQHYLWIQSYYRNHTMQPPDICSEKKLHV